MKPGQNELLPTCFVYYVHTNILSNDSYNVRMEVWAGTEPTQGPFMYVQCVSALKGLNCTCDDYTQFMVQVMQLSNYYQSVVMVLVVISCEVQPGKEAFLWLQPLGQDCGICEGDSKTACNTCVEAGGRGSDALTS